MESFILSNGIAVDRGTPGLKKDADRPLTKDGEEKTHQVAEAMLAMELKFDLILSSPYVRAAKTANIVAGELDDEVTFTDFLLPDANPLELIREITDTKPQSVLLVGHEPDLSWLISLLVSGGSEVTIELKKGGLCKLTTEKLTF